MTALKNKCLHDRYRWSVTLNEGICIDCMAKLTVRPAPSPSQVLTAEESDNDLVEKFMAIIPLADPGFVENLAFECSKVAKKYSTLQTQQLQNRVKELEEQLSVMPTRKHQIVSEVVELREQVKQARNESYKKTIKLAESISFNTEDQAGNKFIAVNLDELIEKITSTSKL